jgi:hypothetical protein
MQTHMERHSDALLAPVTPTERTVSVLFTELTRCADRYRNDRVMLPVVQHLGAALHRMADGLQPGDRIDPSALAKQVRDTVTRAGGDPDAL